MSRNDPGVLGQREYLRDMKKPPPSIALATCQHRALKHHIHNLKGLSPQRDRVVPLQGLVSIKKWPSEEDIASCPVKATMITIRWRFSGREGTGQKPRTKLAPGLLRVPQMKKKLTMCTCQHSCANFLANISKAF